MMSFRMLSLADPSSTDRGHELYNQLSLALRIGLGILFVVGGTFKLSSALDPGRADVLVALYIWDKGYINAFFLDYLFEGVLGNLLTPWLSLQHFLLSSS